MAQPIQLRFDIGSRVVCNTGRGHWPRGTVIALQYRELGWRPGRVAPYQIKLDSGKLIYAPEDKSSLIRPEGESPLPSRVAQGVEDGKRAVDGQWRDECDKISIIRGSHIRWFDGTTSHIKVGMHRTVLLTKQNGNVLRARLSSNGRELRWSDGDVWLRTTSKKGTSSDTVQKSQKGRQLPRHRQLQEAKLLTLFRHFDTDSAGRLRHIELARLWAAVNGGAEFSDAMYCAACAKAGVTPQCGFDIEALGMMYAIGLANLDEHLALLGLVHEDSPDADHPGHHLQSQLGDTDLQLQCEKRTMKDLKKEAEAEEYQRLRQANERDREMRHKAADEERRRKIEEKQRKQDLEETQRRMKAEQKQEESRKKAEAKQLRKAEAKKQHDIERQRSSNLKQERSKQDVGVENQHAKERPLPTATESVQLNSRGPKEAVMKKCSASLKSEPTQFLAGRCKQERPTEPTFGALFGEHIEISPCVSKKTRQQQVELDVNNLAQQQPPPQQQQNPPSHHCIVQVMAEDLAHPMPSNSHASLELGVRGQVVRHAVSSYSAEACGYLSIAMNDLVAIRKGEPSPGDAGCAYLSYVFGWRLADGASGWLPEAVLGCTSWERYQDDDGHPWCYNVETGSWRWENFFNGS